MIHKNQRGMSSREVSRTNRREGCGVRAYRFPPDNRFSQVRRNFTSAAGGQRWQFSDSKGYAWTRLGIPAAIKLEMVALALAGQPIRRRGWMLF